MIQWYQNGVNRSWSSQLCSHIGSDVFELLLIKCTLLLDTNFKREYKIYIIVFLRSHYISTSSLVNWIQVWHLHFRVGYRLWQILYHCVEILGGDILRLKSV